MRILLFFCLLSTSFAFAQESVKLLNPNCTEVKRLDDKGGVLENHPIQHQGNLSTCYANTASVMFYTKMKKENPQSKLKQISWLSLAQRAKSNKIDGALDEKLAKQVFRRGDEVRNVYNAVKGKNICSIPIQDWSLKNFNSSLEANTTVFKRVMNKYEDLFSDDSMTSIIDKKNSFISPTCFDTLNHDFDLELQKSLSKLKQAKPFSKFWKYLKEPKAANLQKLKTFYMTHVFTSTFRKGESNALRFLSSDNFLSGPDDEFDKSLYQGFIDPKMISNFESDLYVLSYDIVEEQGKVLSPLKENLKKQFTRCINTSLSLDPLIKNNQCSKEASDEGKKVLDFTITAVQEGYSPKLIKDLMTMDTPLRTKKDILDNFMKSFYKNCNHKVPDNWKVQTIDMPILKEHANNAKKSPYGFAHDVYSAVIDQGLAGSISFKNSYNKLNPDAKATGQHAMAVIGTANNCRVAGEEKQKCILIQNSYGQRLYQKGKRPSYLIPAISYKTEEQEFPALGKFWMCNEKAIEKYFSDMSILQ